MKNSCLAKIKSDAEINSIKGLRNLFVFDLDSTLFDVSPRSQKILQDFLSNPIFLLKYPSELKQLDKVKINSSDWGIKSSIERLNITPLPSSDFYLAIKKYWTERFFSDDFLLHDQPYSGSVDFVNHFADKPENEIVYLTGRDRQKMLKGTEESLQHSKFPLTGKNISLEMKPNQSFSDTEFKCHWFHQIEKKHYADIWFFEIDPSNIQRVSTEHPQIKIIFFDSTHSGKLKSPSHLPKISDYL